MKGKFFKQVIFLVNIINLLRSIVRFRIHSCQMIFGGMKKKKNYSSDVYRQKKNS